MKLNQLRFSLSALFLLAACGTGIVNAPTPELNTIQTALAGTQTATAPEVSTATAVVSGQDIEEPAATQPAQGPPRVTPEARGIFDHRQDSSIFIIPMVDQQDQSGPSTNQSDQSSGPSFGASSDPNAPKVEVVVTSQTIIYKDVTARGPQAPADFQEIQQVEPGSLDEIAELCLITVWGARTGDRIIADVLVYAFPDMQSQ